jgi:hypothetical protein
MTEMTEQEKAELEEDLKDIERQLDDYYKGTKTDDWPLIEVADTACEKILGSACKLIHGKDPSREIWLKR